MKFFSVIGSAAALSLFASTAAFADANLGVGVKVGTTGLGLEGRWNPVPYMDLRLGVNSYEYDDSGDKSGINYDATLNLDSYYATANFRFPLSPFRVSAGVYANGNELNLISQDDLVYDVGGQTYTSAEVGTLRSTTSFEDAAPYLGFGYDFSLFGKVGMNIDLGVLWQGSPVVSLTADGLAANDPGFQSALENERQQLEDDVKDYKAWPVATLGFFYNF
ncbi:MAG: hypothetical protein HKN77_02440 [Woeseiaceae bacterium]|nr:hypothetical protein [Woeseiaceae bacterium]